MTDEDRAKAHMLAFDRDMDGSCDEELRSLVGLIDYVRTDERDKTEEEFSADLDAAWDVIRAAGFELGGTWKLSVCVKAMANEIKRLNALVAFDKAMELHGGDKASAEATTKAERSEHAIRLSALAEMPPEERERKILELVAVAKRKPE